jgi:chromosome segregation ATPase
MESRIKAEQAEYSRVLAAVTEEAERLRKEKEEVSGLKDVEKQLLSKVGEINDMVEKVRGELKRGNEQLAADEKRLLASEETAKHIKRDIESSSKELEELSKGMKESYKELEAMEKEFAANLECLSKGELEKIGAYSEGRQLAEKFRAFFSKTREIEGMIARAEKEEGELKRHFDALVRKARAFSVVASMPDVKKEIASLQGELMAAEERKSALSAQLKKLRGLVRSVVS